MGEFCGRAVTDPGQAIRGPESTGVGAEEAEHRKSAHEARVVIEVELCKGCEYCVDVCPEQCLSMAETINSHGYHFAQYMGHGCTGCGICFYNCPEPSAISVYKKTRA